MNYAGRILAATSADFAGYQRSPGAFPGVVDLSMGEIQIAHPAWLRAAVAEGAQRAPLGYVDPRGIAGLRQQYVAFLGSQGYAVDERQVLVTAGAKEAIFVALITKSDERTTLLLPQPGWTPYFMWAKGLAMQVRFYDIRGAGLVERLEVLFRQAPSSVLVLNSPHNPTGVEVSRKDFDAIVERARHYGVVVISDEVYRHVARAQTPGSVLDHIQAGERQVIQVDSLSKMLGVAGLRIGFLLADPETVKALEAVRSSVGSCVSSVAQTIAQALLAHEACQHWIAEIKDVCRHHLSSMEEGLVQHGYDVESLGALYLWVRDQLRATGQHTTHIDLGGTPASVSPGHLFGCPGFFRVCPIREKAVLASVLPDATTHE